MTILHPLLNYVPYIGYFRVNFWYTKIKAFWVAH